MIPPIEYLTGNIDIARQPIEYLLDNEDYTEINRVLLTLNPREERIVRLNYGLYNHAKPLTHKEIAILWGVSPSRTMQILYKALKKLRRSKSSSKLKEVLKRKGHCHYKYHVSDPSHLPARHYLPGWKMAIRNHVNKYYWRVYFDFDFKRFYQGKMTTTELQKYFDSKEGIDA
jgi:hypothetical protein